MDPAVLGGKLASSLMASLVRKLFAPDAPGAGLVDRPVRLKSLVSFRGEQRRLGEKEIHVLASRLVEAATDVPGEPPFPPDETTAVIEALVLRLLALGEWNMDDVQAVSLGHRELARRLAHRASPATGLSADADYFLDSATEWACLHILEHFTRRSAFVARTLVEQTRRQAELMAKVDQLLERTPRPGSRDHAFERRYLRHLADRHDHITIYGIDLRDSPDRWPLEVAYLSLEATTSEERPPEEERPPGGPVSVQLPAEEALLAHDRVFLRGDAGSGKTTLVQWLTVTSARDGLDIPYVLPLRTLIRTGMLPAPAEFLAAVSCPHTPPEGWTERVLTAGRGLILVDGLDEIPAPDRTRTRDWLLALIHAFPGNRWLLTSRPTAVRPDWLAGEGFHELAMAPMRRPDIATFVHRWHTAARAPEYEGPLLDSLHTQRDLARLATNPLMCGLICALHRERRGYLPTGRKELYDAALTMLLTRRDLERGMPTTSDLGEEAQLEVLQRLAYALVLSGRTEMDAETAEGIVERCLPSIAVPGDARTVLQSLLLRSGLLRQPAAGVVDFVHRTFQDYLGARYAVEEGHLDVLLSHAEDTQWEDVIRLAVAHARPRERAHLLKALLSHDVPRLTLLALACLEHATALDPAVRTAVESRASALIPPGTKEEARALAAAGPLVLELLPGPAGLTEEAALGVTVTASVLGGEEPAGALAVLRRFRDHPSLEVRRQLAGTWQRFDTEEYATEVLDHLEREHLFLTCKTAEERAALARMRPWHNLAFQGPQRAEDILAAVPAPEAVELLDVQGNPLLTDLAALSAFGSLRVLRLETCPTVAGLDRLSAPLTSLTLTGVEDLSGLRSFSGARYLSLSQELPGADLTESLPVDAPLEFLFLGRNTTDSTGLRGLQHWSGLRTLSLGPLTTELTVGDWQAVVALPELTELHINAEIIQNFPHSVELMPVLPGVETLRVSAMHGAEDVSPLVDRLPGLHSVTLQSYPGKLIPEARYAGVFPGVEINLDQR
ncbi:NACHT domain-containing protein [Streptomyces aquilus]|uniref:NACHT domain-containing protein n=1 Tax=Streptomyces aquilus TaxID=2548456 RepID=A0A3S9I548_9ACTN|nr:NACHT domain-containing protein [Streptomyces aquilus]AZP19480.1 NACHT domain-containing protein [Streptomyces aquilus]